MHKLVLAAVLACAAPSIAVAQVRSESFCNLKGFDAPLRQTVLVLDGAHVGPEPDKSVSEANRVWRSFIGRFLDIESGFAEQSFLPRERVTLLVANDDGSGVSEVFSGCLPFYSEAEKQALKLGTLEVFLGRGAIADAKKEGGKVRTALALGMAGIAQKKSAQSTAGNDSSIENAGIIRSLKRSSFVNLDQGIPRIFLLSNLARFSPGSANSVMEARAAGRAAGEDLGLDLKRAELYVVGVEGSKSVDLVQEYLHSFMLASRAELVGISNWQGLGNLRAAPTRISIFQGAITYPTGKLPMRMRLSTDQNGSTVNSWVSVHSDQDRFTPFNGILNCQEETCEFLGDRQFAQIWTDNPDREPEFDEWMPFSGVREFVFTLKGERIVGRAFDSSVTLQGTKDNALHFELSKLTTGQF